MAQQWLRAERVEKPEDLAGAIERAMANRPSLLDVVVTPEAASSDAKSGLAWVPDLQPLAFQRLTGELSAANEDSKASLAYKQLAFTLSDGVAWPASSGSLSWQHPAWPGGWPSDTWAQTQGGSLRAENRAEGGARFVVDLPMFRQQ